MRTASCLAVILCVMAVAGAEEKEAPLRVEFRLGEHPW